MCPICPICVMCFMCLFICLLMCFSCYPFVINFVHFLHSFHVFCLFELFHALQLFMHVFIHVLNLLFMCYSFVSFAPSASIGPRVSFASCDSLVSFASCVSLGGPAEIWMHLQCFLYDPDIPYENIRADYHHVCCSVSVSSGTPLSACLTTSLMTIVLCFCVIG